MKKALPKKIKMKVGCFRRDQTEGTKRDNINKIHFSNITIIDKIKIRSGKLLYNITQMYANL